MQRLRRCYYRRDVGGPEATPHWGAHLALSNGVRTLCNRPVRGDDWRSGTPEEGKIHVCDRCQAIAGACPDCRQDADGHFDYAGRWIGCAPVQAAAR